MGKLRQTRRAMTFAGHSVGHVNGKVETMKCRDCGQVVPVASKGDIGVIPNCKPLSQVVEVLVPEEGV